MVGENFRMRTINRAIDEYTLMHTHLDKKALCIIKKLWWYSKREYNYLQWLGTDKAAYKFNLTDESYTWLENNASLTTDLEQVKLRLRSGDSLLVKDIRHDSSWDRFIELGNKGAGDVNIIDFDIIREHFEKEGLASDILSDEEITNFMEVLGDADPWLPNPKYVYKKLESNGFKCGPEDRLRYTATLLVELKSAEKTAG